VLLGGLVAGLAAALVSPGPGFAAPTTAALTTTEDSAPHPQAAALGEVLSVRAPFRSDQAAPEPVAVLQEQVPALKARWLNSGDTAALLQELRQIASGVWSLELEPRQPLTYTRLH